MKNVILISIALLLGSSQISAQGIKQDSNTITVTGESIIQLSPNEIILAIRYEEYFSDDNKQKTSIEVIEKQLVKALKEAGVKDKNITYSAVQMARDYDRTKRKYYNNRLYKTINVCVYTADEIARLIKVLEKDNLLDKEISSFGVGELRHTDMEKYKQQAKVEAIQDAQAKAKLILKTLGKKLGDINTIEEISEPRNATDNSQGFYGTATSASANTGMSPITIGYKVQAVFRIE